MIPKSVSATAILVSEACPERYRVENIERAPQGNSIPAMVGTVAHYAFEHFVLAVYINETVVWSNKAYLMDMLRVGYIDTFGNANFDTDEFKDAEQMVESWYERNSPGLQDKVISCEVKETFMIKTSAGEIPFNFIWDRCDEIGPKKYRIVDYKSFRRYVNADELKGKIQPRAYALAAQIKWPDAEEIWVAFDLLRHNGEVGVKFTRADNIATYRYLQRAVERILLMEPDPETGQCEERINDECKWCVKKTTCGTLAKSISAGSVQSMSLTQLAERKLLIDSQMQALSYAQEELDKAIVAEAELRDEFEFTEGDYEFVMGISSRRKVNSNAVAHIVGEELSVKYGNFTMTNIDKMLKNEDLPADVKKRIKAEITTNYGSPSPKIKKVASF